MAISGNAREPFSDGFTRKVGLAVCEVLAFNPDASELEQILGSAPETVPQYLTKTEDNKPLLNIEIWLKEVKTGLRYKLRMRPLQNEVFSLDSGKVRFVDDKGNTSYFLDKKENLVDWMQENNPRPARFGEVELFKFLRAHQGLLRAKEITDFTIDWDRLMSGDVSELNELKHNGFATNVLVVLTVRLDKRNDEVKVYQNVFNSAFLPGDYMRFFRNKGSKQPTNMPQFIKEVTDPEHGCKDFFGAGRVLREMHDYDPSENPLESDSAVLSGDIVNGESEIDFSASEVEISTDY